MDKKEVSEKKKMKKISFMQLIARMITNVLTITQ